MVANFLPVWKKAPFIRFVFPLMAGVAVQWELQFTLIFLWTLFGSSVLASMLSSFLSYFRRYKFGFISGTGIVMACFSLGSLLVWYKDIRHDAEWYGHYADGSSLVMATLREPVVEKTNSWKALAAVNSVQKGNERIRVKGDMVIYFSKDSVLQLDYGSQIIFCRTLQEIRSAGNPGGFDYKQYSLFRGITHQVYLKKGEFVILEATSRTWVGKILFLLRKQVLSSLRRTIRGGKEQGLAEALLIGYKDDLDKNLVQSYTNTGVVHVIAISGLHLGLIYLLLVQLLRPLRKRRGFKWIVPLAIIPALWVFSLLAGGQPSVLRSAVMFTCVVLGESLSRKSSIYNTLALSAFILLCINPYWLWDIGFQLSYAAVLSIVVFMKPIYGWFYTSNKVLDFVWKLNAITLAAQLLTTPFSIYHFHQFPNYFLLTNFVAVPLSSVIVLGEIFLIAVAFLPFIAIVLGKLLTALIWLMNWYVRTIESLPHSVWDSMQINAVQLALLIAGLAGVGYWFLEKRKFGAWAAVIALFIFVCLRSISFSQANAQEQLVIYNIARYRAIDVIQGRDYSFIGDSILLQNEFVCNFHLRPSRIQYRVRPGFLSPRYFITENFIAVGNKKILLIDTTMHFDATNPRIPIDVLVISKSPRLYLEELIKTFDIKQVVFDGSNATRRVSYWKKDCDILHLRFYDVSEKGAFVMKLN